MLDRAKEAGVGGVTSYVALVHVPKVSPGAAEIFLFVTYVPSAKAVTSNS